MTTAEAATATEESSPITAGATTKKGKPQPAKGKAVAKTAAPKASANGAGRASANWPDENIISVTKPDALKAHEVRGKRRDALDTFKDGMTVEKFRAAMAKKDLKTHFTWALDTATSQKFITVKKP